ncbi:OmpH family outer membrane protein [Flavobacterium sp.]|uniref:OmpH family outer membrane protein n=1 Tax=Flavobacterium sp. TaxID=239 RepID=UPI00286CF180|nr:OmpH family outer membrane protein [Flavobacterium sp.]
MKKFFLSIIFFAAIFQGNAQAKGVKIGYIDMDYILENVPDYREASVQLEQKAQKWKQDIEVKKNEIIKLKDGLKIEKALLTKELVDERDEEIKFLESELLDYQQKRFGPNGDLMVQKSSIIKPIQDQVFNAVQDIADAKKYDFIFDKSSDLTMLFSAKRYDISDQVVRTITRAGKKEEMSKKQLKALEEKEAKEDVVDENPVLADRKKLLDEKKALARKAIEDRKELVAQKKKDFEEKRKKLIEEAQAKKNGTTIDSTKTTTTNVVNDKLVDPRKVATDSLKSVKEKERLLLIENNKKNLQDKKEAVAQKKKEFEERRKKLLEDQEAKRAEKLKQKEQQKP